MGTEGLKALLPAASPAVATPGSCSASCSASAKEGLLWDEDKLRLQAATRCVAITAGEGKCAPHLPTGCCKDGA